MRAAFALSVGLAVAGLAGMASAEPLALGEALESSELDGQRGGTETVTEINGSVLQTNETSQTATNTGNVSVTGGAAKINGAIHGANVNGNRGITAVMQNTGDLVNMNNATSVNVFLK